MLNIFKPQILYVRIHRNMMDVKNLNNGKYVSKKATIPYSNSRLIMADYEVAEEFLRSLVAKSMVAEYLVSRQ